MKNSKTYQNIYRWDIDKTYLSSELDSVRDYLRTAFEKPEEKENVPGTASLIKELHNGPNVVSQKNPIYFLSASPEQMRKKLLKKMELDGIICAGLILKNQLSHLRKMHFSRLKKQIGYKVAALLKSRASLSISIPEIAFGDDTESDAVIYSLYSDITARRIVGASLRSLLVALELEKEETDAIFNLVANLPVHDPIELIYINVVSKNELSYFDKFGERLIPTQNSFQSALHLCQHGKISQDGLIRVGKEMTDLYKFPKEKLGASMVDLYNRGFLLNDFVKRIFDPLKDEFLIPAELAFVQPKFSIAQKVKNWWKETFQIGHLLSEEEPLPGAKYLDEIKIR